MEKINILVLTSNYSGTGIPRGTTPVVAKLLENYNYKENIRVIYNYTVYSKVLYVFFSLFNNLLSNILGSVLPKKRNSNINLELINGIKVIRIPIFKFFPRFKFTNKTYSSQFKQIQKYITENDFEPYVVIGHWLTPQLKLLNMLKDEYQCKIVQVIHELEPFIVDREYGENSEELLSDLDMIAYRSESIRSKFENKYKLLMPNFICRSGIDKNKIIRSKEFNKDFLTITFVGLLIKRKHPSSIIKAVSLASFKNYCQINFIGEGPEKHNLEKLAAKYDLNNQIKLYGYVYKEIVIKLLDKTDCFVMISELEAFGLVYLEAMARGCIVVASRNEGFDGIIINGYNGFLCESGNKNQLNSILNKIYSLSDDEKINISKRAIETATKLNSKNVSNEYFEIILKN